MHATGRGVAIPASTRRCVKVQVFDARDRSAVRIVKILVIIDARRDHHPDRVPQVVEDQHGARDGKCKLRLDTGLRLMLSLHSRLERAHRVVADEAHRTAPKAR